MEGGGSSISPTAGKPIKCRAAICRRAGEPLSIEEIEVDPPKAWEVRIKILCTSLCHSDLSSWKLDSGPFAIFPRIFGHEAIGVVESVGKNVDEVEEGDTVLPVFQPNCGACADCKSSKSNRCSVFDQVPPTPDMARDGTSRFRASDDGQVIHHFLRVSSFSEYTVVDVANVVKIDGLGATWKVADVEEGSAVAIFGLGAVGLASRANVRWQREHEYAELPGSSGSTLIPRNSISERSLGSQISLTLPPAERNQSARAELSVRVSGQVIGEMTGGGADYCFECVGSAPVMADAFDSSREGYGKTVVLGLDMHGTPLSLSSIGFLKGRTVTGCFFGGLKPKIDIPIIARKYSDGELNLDDFITQEVSFHEINKAFELLVQGKSLRCIVWMDK